MTSFVSVDVLYLEMKVYMLLGFFFSVIRCIFLYIYSWH